MLNEAIAKTRLVTVLGGSGFIGRHVVQALVKDGWRIRVGCRRPDLAVHLEAAGEPGQVTLAHVDLHHPRTIAAALEGANAAVNLVGILNESGGQTFAAIMSRGARSVAEAVANAGITKFVHVSAIGAAKSSSSAYARSKAEGEAAVRELVPQAIILRPSIVFGPEDDFFNRFATMARLMPVLPLVGARTRFQPVFVDDVAQSIVLALDGRAVSGATYELGGPEVKTFHELVRFVCDVTHRHRQIISLSFETGKLMAIVTQIASKLSLGLFPKLLTMTADQVELLRHDNVVSNEARAAGRTFEALGLTPHPIDAIVPNYLRRERHPY